MLSPETTTGALALLKLVVGSMNSPSPVSDLEASAVKGALTPATTRTVANKRNTAVAIVTEFFFLLLLRLYIKSIPVKSAMAMNKRIPLIKRG